MLNKTIIFFLLISSSLIAQNDYKKEQALREKNKIKEKLTYTFKTDSKDSILTKKDIYDINGKHIQDIRYDEKGIVRYQYNIEYNENGMMNKQSGYDYGKISTILTYSYDDSNNRIEYFQHNPEGELLNNQIRIYDKSNLNTKLFNKSIKYDLFYLASEYYYTKKKLYSKILNFYPSGKLRSTSIYIYKKNLIKTYDDKVKRKNLVYIREYNDFGQLIKKEWPKEKKAYEYIYDSDGNIIEELIYIDKVLDSKKKIYYTRFST